MYKKILIILGSYLVLGFSSQVVFATTFNTNLSVGAKNSEVALVQTFLINEGHLSGTATGYFGDLTKKAVQAFQKKNNLPTTGGWFALTRAKANLLTPSSASTQSVITPKEITQPTISSQKKDIVLTITTTSGGLVYYSDNTVACYHFETCKKVFPVGTKIVLKAVPLSGYAITGWSEASCGTSLECSVPLISDTVVSVRFAVIGVPKRVGKILYPTTSDVCYVGLGLDKCNLPVYWINDTALDMSLKVDGVEYAIAPEDPNSPTAKYPMNPSDILASEPQNGIGPVYFALTPETYSVELRSAGQILDTVKVQVKCSPGDYLQYGRTCWRDGAKRVFVFKQQGILIKSDPPGIACGYKNEVCAAAFPGNSKVTLTAIPMPGYTFSGWSESCSGISSTCSIIMDKDKNVGIQNAKYTGNTSTKTTAVTIPEKTETPVPGCTPNWQCDGWGICSSTKMTRSCYDLNKCNSSVNKPQTTLGCEIQTWR